MSAERPPTVVQIRRQRVTTDQLRDMLARNPRDAARWIEAAAKAGSTSAQIVWGQLLLDGHGVPRDAKAAFISFGKAATCGDIEARNMVGRCYEQGWGVPVDLKRATESFEIAARTGHLWGQVNLAQMLTRAGDPADRPRCFALFKAAAESGTRKANLKAMNSLARFLEEGWAGTPDPAGAAFWYLRAANLGDHWAQYNLATILFRQGDHEGTDRWLRTAIANADNGFRRRVTPLLLGRPEMMLRQRGLDALARCAAGEAPEDLYSYGLALDEGVAGLRDPNKAVALFKRAAAKGHGEAAARLQAKRRAFASRGISAFVRAIRRSNPRIQTPTPSHARGIL
jgi:TPR repeat protein